ncbi:hypothetical protein Acr_10g0003210 [Actinidia rufa]|uniref:Transposase (putative) gypsy type domain-containing protein n=1 Tax=Actinidia rufa TaxID=165716 RepID=A0A7J0F945_9ERIC|nr:hypothetical protein Acr_10g0003210 [Actinidia rufa]
MPMSIQIRLLKGSETISSARPSEVAFYEAAFHAGLRPPIHPTIKMILQFYNICSSHLVPNPWWSVVCAIVLWRSYKYATSLFEFRNLFSLNKNPNPDHGWLYFKARPKKTLLKGYPSNVKGWKRKFFFISKDNWEFPKGIISESWGSKGPEGNKGEDRPIDDTPVPLGYAAISKRISLTKLTEKMEEKSKKVESSKGVTSTMISTPPTKGIVIREKRPRNELPTISSSDTGRKLKEAMPLPETKRVIMLRNAATAKKILEAYIPPFDKEEVDKLELDQMVSKLFHILGQQFVEELAKPKEERDAIADGLVKLEVLVTKMKEKSEGFNFYKRQLAHYHPILGIELGGMEMDYDLIAKEEDGAEEKEEDKKKGQDGEKDKKGGD